MVPTIYEWGRYPWTVVPSMDGRPVGVENPSMEIHPINGWSGSMSGMQHVQILLANSRLLGLPCFLYRSLLYLLLWRG